MSVQMQGKWIAVEKLGRSAKKDTWMAGMEDTSAVGVVKFLGASIKNERLGVGTKVYFGKVRHELKIDGVDVFVMDEENIYAIVEESNVQTQSPVQTT